MFQTSRAQSPRSRIPKVHVALAVGVLALAATGCGRIVEKATEKAVEKVIESDSGGDVDINFRDGQIRVESSEGDITFTADEDGVKIRGTDADGNDFSVDANEDGLAAQSDGHGSLDVDGDGTFVATGEDGKTFSGEADADGGYRVADGDGETVFASSDGIPDKWPSDIPQPDGLTDVTGTYFGDGDDLSIIITGTASGGLKDTFTKYTNALTNAGFTEESTFTQGNEAASSTFLRGERHITVSIQSVDGGSQMVVAVG